MVKNQLHHQYLDLVQGLEVRVGEIEAVQEEEVEEIKVVLGQEKVEEEGESLDHIQEEENVLNRDRFRDLDQIQ